MTHSKRTAALALTGAVALASGAYALGSQSDGSASAAGEDRRGPHMLHLHPRERVDDMADRLGVEADELREALEDVRGDLPGPDDFAADLADELGTTTAKVEAALERVRERHADELGDRHREFTEALADRLGIDAERVEEAFEPPRLPDPPERP